jgi:hypothetical protein
MTSKPDDTYYLAPELARPSSFVAAWASPCKTKTGFQIEVNGTQTSLALDP